MSTNTDKPRSDSPSTTGSQSPREAKKYLLSMYDIAKKDAKAEKDVKKERKQDLAQKRDNKYSFTR